MKKMSGFSLLELLAVLAIFAILTATIIPKVSSVSQSYQLGIASQTLADEIRLCRAYAATKNKPIELSFQRSPNATGGDFIRFNSRSLEQDGSTQWLSLPKKMPEGIVISGSKTLSNILGNQSLLTNAEGQKEVCLRFHPSGEMELVSPDEGFTDPSQFITLGYQSDFQRNPNQLPSNFVTIEIDPRNSQTLIYRP